MYTTAQFQESVLCNIMIEVSVVPFFNSVSIHFANNDCKEGIRSIELRIMTSNKITGLFLFKPSTKTSGILEMHEEIKTKIKCKADKVNTIGIIIK